MTNEELVFDIQNGNTDRLPELWENISHLVSWKAARVCRAMESEYGVQVEFDDLYQSGYIAMVAAVKGYNVGRGQFTTWLMFYLKAAFAEAQGRQPQRRKQDPSLTAYSLNTPISSEEGDTVEAGELIPDPKAAAEIEAAEEKVFLQELRQALAAALQQIPSSCSRVLKLRYYDGLTIATVADSLQISPSEVRKLEALGMKEIRRPRNKRALAAFFFSDDVGSPGLSAYRSSGMSIQERHLIRQERKAAPVADKHRQAPAPSADPARSRSLDTAAR